MNTSSVDRRDELRAECIQSVTNQNVESEDNREDAMEIDSKSAANSGEALAMLDKFQVFFKGICLYFLSPKFSILFFNQN